MTDASWRLHTSAGARACTGGAGFAIFLFVLALCPGAARADDLIGAVAAYTTKARDTLLDIARQHDIGFVAIRAANPSVDPWVPGSGRRIVIPGAHLLPNAPHLGIVINLPELRLYYFPEGQGAPMSFPVGIGDEGKGTPLGLTEVVRKKVHPTWIPTPSERQENPELPAIVGPGPDNPMGEYALYLGWTGYAIHGSNKPYSVGRRDSHGCIRMYPEDVAVLFRIVEPGTPVVVINQPVKTGWHKHELYLEIHPDLQDANRIEAGDGLRLRPALVDALIRKALQPDHLDRVDWSAVRTAGFQRRGVPIRVTYSER